MKVVTRAAEVCVDARELQCRRLEPVHTGPRRARSRGGGEAGCGLGAQPNKHSQLRHQTSVQQATIVATAAVAMAQGVAVNKSLHWLRVAVPPLCGQGPRTA